MEHFSESREGNGGRWLSKMTLQHCHQVEIKTSALGLLTVELKPNLQSVAQLDVQP